MNEDIVISATNLKKNKNNKNEFFHRDLIGCKVINFNSEEESIRKFSNNVFDHNN